jgi:SET domain-containing protein
MYINIQCLKCGKRYKRLVEYECELELYASDFCGVCRKGMMEDFERQFEVKKITRRIHVEDDDGA